MVDLNKSDYHLSKDSFEKLFACAEAKPWMKEKRRDESLSHLFYLCDKDKEVELLIELLSEFELSKLNEISDFVYDTIQKVMNIPNVTSENCGFVAKPNNESRFDSSKAIMTMLQSLFPAESGFNKYNLYGSAQQCLKDPKIEHVVLVDDFSGTGCSLFEYVSWIDDYCGEEHGDNINVHAFFYRAMYATKNRSYPKRLTTIDAKKWMNKGISDVNIFQVDILDKIETMKALEANFEKLKPKYSLGYQASETLYACEGHSTPNNVFPIFWFKKVKDRKFHRPLLVRK